MQLAYGDSDVAWVETGSGRLRHRHGQSVSRFDACARDSGKKRVVSRKEQKGPSGTASLVKNKRSQAVKFIAFGKGDEERERQLLAAIRLREDLLGHLSGLAEKRRHSPVEALHVRKSFPGSCPMAHDRCDITNNFFVCSSTFRMKAGCRRVTSVSVLSVD